MDQQGPTSQVLGFALGANSEILLIETALLLYMLAAPCPFGQESWDNIYVQMWGLLM